MTSCTTTQSKRVLQVFQNINRYGKDQNTHAQRQALTRWNSPILSSTGYVEGQRLVLNAVILDYRLQFEACDTLILNDYNHALTQQHRRSLSNAPAEEYTFLELRTRPQRHDIFSLHWSDDGFELYLDYSRNSFWIGQPRRADYKLANLREQQAVRISINGKHDFSMTGRRARTYLTADYIFVYLGEYSHFEICASKEVTQLKTVPLDVTKHIDLMTILR